jgi:hypothetical protein
MEGGDGTGHPGIQSGLFLREKYFKKNGSGETMEKFLTLLGTSPLPLGEPP